MPELNVGALMADIDLRLTGIASKKYPKGKTYIPAELTWTDTVRFRRLLPILTGDAVRSDDTERFLELTLDQFLRNRRGEPITLAEKLLGPAYDEMVEDGVDAVRMDRVTAVLISHHGYGEEAARRLASTPPRPVQPQAESTKKPRARKVPAKQPARKVAAKKAVPGRKPAPHAQSSKTSGART